MRMLLQIPPRNGGSAKLLTEVVILDWDEQPPSPFTKLWMVFQASMIVRAISEQLGVPNSEFPVQTAGMNSGLGWEGL